MRVLFDYLCDDADENTLLDMGQYVIKVSRNKEKYPVTVIIGSRILVKFPKTKIRLSTN